MTGHAISSLPPLLPGLSALAERYDGFILDLWGVVHDGRAVFPWVLDTLQALRRAGKRVVLLSNAPRRESVVARRNAEIGLPGALVDGLVTSGEEAWRHLHDRPDDFYRALGRRCLHLGSSRDLSMREGLPYDFVDALESADFLLNTGSSQDPGFPLVTPELLARAAERDLPMVCANPDRVVVVGGARQLCAGAVADHYELLAGRVRWHGKPHAAVYDRAVERLAVADRARVLCIGDSVETDLKGAAAAGLDALFIAGGIHLPDIGRTETGEPDPDGIRRLMRREAMQPVAALARFTW